MEGSFKNPGVLSSPFYGKGGGSINRDFVKRAGAECGEDLSDIGNRVTDGVADTVRQDSWE